MAAGQMNIITFNCKYDNMRVNIEHSQKICIKVGEMNVITNNFKYTSNYLYNKMKH